MANPDPELKTDPVPAAPGPARGAPAGEEEPPTDPSGSLAGPATPRTPSRPPPPPPAARAGATNPTAAPARPPPPPPVDPLIGKVLDNRYRLVQLIAKGGMGRVYKAEQAPLGRVVAVKVLEVDGDDPQDVEFRDRFTREAAACARLTHPNTIRIYDFGKTWDDVHFIAMEHLEGRNLHAAIRAEAPMPVSMVVHIATQICLSLREAHSLGLIHRDLKPSNVMLQPSAEELPFVKVLDFGLVKELRNDSELTRADAVVGSPSYMSPEQIRAAPVDQRSDIYALGVLLFACLTGRTPFSGESSVNVLMAHLQRPAPTLAEVCPGLPPMPVMEWVVATCLQKTAEQRFGSVDELRRALQLAAAEATGAPVALPRLVNGRVVVGLPPEPPTLPLPGTPPPAAAPPLAPAPPAAAPLAPAPVPLPPAAASPVEPGPSGVSSPSMSQRAVRAGVPVALGLGAGLFLALLVLGVVALWVFDRRGAATPGVEAALPAAAGPAAAGDVAAGDAAAGPAHADAPTPGATAAPPSAAAPAASATSSGPAGPAPGADPPAATRTRARGAPPPAATPTAAAPPEEPAPEPVAEPAPAAKPPPDRPPSDLRDPWKSP